MILAELTCLTRQDIGSASKCHVVVFSRIPIVKTFSTSSLPLVLTHNCFQYPKLTKIYFQNFNFVNSCDSKHGY